MAEERIVLLSGGEGEYEEKNIYTIVNYGVGEILGNLEYYAKIKNYLCSAQCISNSELYEIDINLYKKIESNENIEFLNKKTKKQLEFYKKRIKEINLIHKKNNKEYYTGRNKFMKAYYHNNPEFPLNEKEKEYINNAKNPLPIKIILKNKKLKNTKFSFFGSLDWGSFILEDKDNLNINLNININDEIRKSSNPFTTNNKECPNNFKENKFLIDDIDKNNKQNKSIFYLNNKGSKNIKYNHLKTRNKNRYKTLSLLNQEKHSEQKISKKKEMKFDFGKIFASNEFSKFLSYSSSLSPKNSMNEKNNINLSKKTFNKKFRINFFSPARRIYSNSNSKIIVNLSPAKININKTMRIIEDKTKLNLKEENKKKNKENEIKDKKILSDKNNER